MSSMFNLAALLGTRAPVAAAPATPRAGMPVNLHAAGAGPAVPPRVPSILGPRTPVGTPSAPAVAKPAAHGTVYGAPAGATQGGTTASLGGVPPQQPPYPQAPAGVLHASPSASPTSTGLLAMIRAGLAARSSGDTFSQPTGRISGGGY